MTAILLQLAYLAAIGLGGCTAGWIVLRADKNRATKTLVLCQMLIIIWCLPQLFLVFPVSRTVKYILYSISYIGISLIGPSWLLFSLFYCGRRPGTHMKVLMYGISLLNYVVFLTNEAHHLFYLRFELEEVVYGPVFYFHMVYTYLCVLSGMAAVLISFRKNKVPLVHVAAMILAAAVPLGFNVLYLSGAVRAGFDLTPPVFALSSFIMLLAVFRYDFLDVDVAASRHVLGSIAEGVVVSNRKGIVTYCNDMAAQWTGVKSGDRYSDILEKFSFGDSGENEITVHMPGGESLRLRQYILCRPTKAGSLRRREDRTGETQKDEGSRAGQAQTCPLRQGAETARILVITDISEYYELVRQSRELAVSQQRLAIEQERTRIAQEVHDTTGHTLTMLNSLIKLISISYKEETGKTWDERQEERTHGQEMEEYLKQAQELASGGIRELRWSINHLRQGTECELVSQGVYQLAASVREVEVEVEIQGEDGPEYSHLSGIVYQCLREAITNCLKYANASHMDVIVKFGSQDVNMYIFDDGQGCSLIRESHGLRGIRERADHAGGTVRFLSAEGEGFQTFLQLPV